MNDSELAKLMLEWEERQADADALAATIKEEILQRGESFTVGNVRATYSNPRRKYNYDVAWFDFNAAEPGPKFRKETIDFKAACEDQNIDMEKYFTITGKPSVRLKIK